MAHNKTKRTQVRLRISQDNLDWLNKMDAKGCDKGVLVDIALSILIPRVGNIKTTEERIIEVSLTKKETDY